ncbi:hypothetical protein DXA38_07160 [[Clostridium] innocuum]|uniref:Uncharacterized protein n=1 Tax=Clostridium innocuum TaxID=1522 RepID=A0A3E2VYZ7_CLOIN|nr:hypothetical protein DXA38_07160 [[Clostridium] innocuum]RHV64773.1 hypothetical protein DXB22_09890 [Clostridiaceae bacterium OM02-2AC]
MCRQDISALILLPYLPEKSFGLHPVKQTTALILLQYLSKKSFELHLVKRRNTISQVLLEDAATDCFSF